MAGEAEASALNDRQNNEQLVPGSAVHTEAAAGYIFGGHTGLGYADSAAVATAAGEAKLEQAMNIDHVALCVEDLEAVKEFFVRYFGAEASRRYVNEAKGLSSYFLSFDDNVRLGIMHLPGMPAPSGRPDGPHRGYTHIALSVGSKRAVDELTDRLRSEGCPILDGPRTTGDGYYESVVLDPEGNRVEITV